MIRWAGRRSATAECGAAARDNERVSGVAAFGTGIGWFKAFSKVIDLVASVTVTVPWHRCGESDVSGAALAITAAITRPVGYSAVISNARNQRARAHGPQIRSSSVIRSVVSPPGVLMVATPSEMATL